MININYPLPTLFELTLYHPENYAKNLSNLSLLGVWSNYKTYCLFGFMNIKENKYT